MADLELKPAPALSDAQKEQIKEAVVAGFSPGELTSTLKYKWGLVLGNYVDLHQGLYGVVDDLIAWTDRRGKTRDLATLVYAERDGNSAVQQMAAGLGLEPALAGAKRKYDPAQPAPPRPSLEALVSHHSRLIDYNMFLARFQSLGDRVCKVQTPTKLGTGFLVGADRVLTNFHVMDCVKTDDDARRCRCFFDFRDSKTETAEKIPPRAGGTPCGFASKWLEASSPYSDSDVGGAGEPQAGELDYALLRLAENVGDAAGPGGKRRGWFELTADRPVLALRDFVVIPQHAEGDPLEVAWGAVLSYNDSGNRIRYDVTTDLGSSGSPCLTADLEIFGLHHASEPKNNPTFNQAVPLDLIARDLKSKGVI